MKKMMKALVTTMILCAVAMTASAQEMPWFWKAGESNETE